MRYRFEASNKRFSSAEQPEGRVFVPSFLPDLVASGSQSIQFVGVLIQKLVRVAHLMCAMFWWRVPVKVHTIQFKIDRILLVLCSISKFRTVLHSGMQRPWLEIGFSERRAMSLR